MSDLRTLLDQALRGRTGFVGLGNPEYGDDGLGVVLAQALQRRGCPRILVAGACPERLLAGDEWRAWDRLVFLDAVEFGGAPGSVVFLNRREMQARFPQVSTHKISVGLLAQMMEADGAVQVSLLGVQPQSMRAGFPLSEPVLTTLNLLTGWLAERLRYPRESASAVPALESSSL